MSCILNPLLMHAFNFTSHQVTVINNLKGQGR